MDPLEGRAHGSRDGLASMLGTRRMKWGEPLTIRNREQWRTWLESNHATAPEAFVLHVKQSSPAQGPTYDELVEESLCFGWIDGIARRFDDDFTLARFTPRKKSSNWSASNRDRVTRLAIHGLIHESGWAAIPEDVKSVIRAGSVTDGGRVRGDVDG